MSYTFECPFCNEKIDVPDELDNTSAQCPACGQEIYLTRDDAVEESDAVIESMRKEAREKDRQHMDQLRMVAMMQQAEERADKRTKSIINVLLWIFLWGPLCLLAFYIVIWLLLKFVRGY